MHWKQGVGRQCIVHMNVNVNVSDLSTTYRESVSQASISHGAWPEIYYLWSRGNIGHWLDYILQGAQIKFHNIISPPTITGHNDTDNAAGNYPRRLENTTLHWQWNVKFLENVWSWNVNWTGTRRNSYKIQQKLPFNGDFIAASTSPANSWSDFGSWASPWEKAARASACLPRHWRATPSL